MAQEATNLSFQRERTHTENIGHCVHHPLAKMVRTRVEGLKETSMAVPKEMSSLKMTPKTLGH